MILLGLVACGLLAYRGHPWLWPIPIGLALAAVHAAAMIYPLHLAGVATSWDAEFSRHTINHVAAAVLGFGLGRAIRRWRPAA